jgi:hypothetical protein
MRVCIQVVHAWRVSLSIWLRYLVLLWLLDDLYNYMLELQSDYHLDASTLLK